MRRNLELVFNYFFISLEKQKKTKKRSNSVKDPELVEIIKNKIIENPTASTRQISKEITSSNSNYNPHHYNFQDYKRKGRTR